MSIHSDPLMEATLAAEKHGIGWDRWLVLFLIFGVGLRVFRYALGLPLWVDEGFLGVNILERSFRGLLQPMEYIQVAPLGFLWAERAMYQLFGMSEYIMRLIPTLAGIAGLILFVVWARKTVDPLAATLAVAVFAVSDVAVRNAVELKPYGIDQLAGVVLLYLATSFLLDRKTTWLWCLVVATPIALFFSLPSVFVAGGIAAALCFDLPRLAGRQRTLVLIFLLVLCSTFGVLVWGFIGPQLAGTGPSQEICWVFPPFNPLKFAAWFFRTHSGNFFGYPLDFTTPGSAPSFLALVIGAAVLFRRGPGRLGLLIISPFVMTFIAAMLRRYPYGDSPRVGQHLVGPICLLIGVGSAAIIRRFARSERAVRRAGVTVFIVLIVIGLIAPAVLIIAPSREMQRDFTVRRFVRAAMTGILPQTTVAVVERPDYSDILSRWYVHEGSHRIVWGVPISGLPKVTDGPLLIVSSPIDLTGLEGRIEREMGTAPQRDAKLAIPNQVGYEFMYYPKH
jgi:4-amino-4-deoxy-L-arabinose transferase-like glycosyltransferase